MSCQSYPYEKQGPTGQDASLQRPSVTEGEMVVFYSQAGVLINGLVLLKAGVLLKGWHTWRASKQENARLLLPFLPTAVIRC